MSFSIIWNFQSLVCISPLFPKDQLILWFQCLRCNSYLDPGLQDETMKQIYTHCNDVIMGVMASQITSLTIVYWTLYSGADQRKHQFTGDWWIPRTKGQQRGKCFHLMTSSWRNSWDLHKFLWENRHIESTLYKSQWVNPWDLCTALWWVALVLSLTDVLLLIWLWSVYFGEINCISTKLIINSA